MTWEQFKKLYRVGASFSTGITLIQQCMTIHVKLEADVEGLATIVSALVLPAGVGLVVGTSIFGIGTIAIGIKENKARKAKQERLVFSSDMLIGCVERCEVLLNKFQTNPTYRIKLEAELNALWHELEKLRIPCPQVELWGEDENSGEWLLCVALLKPLMKTANVDAARELMS